MSSFYTSNGDDGYTGWLGEGRLPKYDLRIETVGTLDEASAALGMARSSAESELTAPLIIQVQRDLYSMMGEIAADPELAGKFRVIGLARVVWLEEQTDALSKTVSFPKDFILAGDSPCGAILDLARTIIRRAERRAAELFHRHEITNEDLLRYLNRLSSLCFALEIYENQVYGVDRPSLAKPEDHP